VKCITAVGDLTQKLKWPEGLDSWERSGLFLPGQEVVRGIFKINYRQTFELGLLAHEYHRHAFEQEPLFVPCEKTRGPKPSLTVVKDLERELKQIIRLVPDILSRLHFPTIALVVEDDGVRPKYFEELGNALSSTIECFLSKGKDLRIRQVLHIVALDDIKGLEFDAVIIADANKILHTHKNESAMITARNRLYVAITRAREELHIFSYRSIPPVLWAVRNHLHFNNVFKCPRCGASNKVAEAASRSSDLVACNSCHAQFKPPFTKDQTPEARQSD
jgi:hypothetical protein